MTVTKGGAVNFRKTRLVAFACDLHQQVVEDDLLLVGSALSLDQSVVEIFLRHIVALNRCEYEVPGFRCVVAIDDRLALQAGVGGKPQVCGAFDEHCACCGRCEGSKRNL